MTIISGAITAIITPFTSEYKVDLDAFTKIIKWQISNGISGIIISGTTGEDPTITDNEFPELLKTASRTIKGKIPIIANVSSNSTLKAIQRVKIAENFGADIVMAVVPYYNKPTQNGIYEHFSLIARSSLLPVIIYNAPGRTVASIEVDTVKKLAQFDNIIAIKDCPSDVSRYAELSGISDKFKVFTGDDTDMVAARSMGAAGVMSVISNLIPDVIVRIHQYCNQSKYDLALDLYRSALSLTKMMFVETNPIPLKYAMSRIGLCENILRLPMTPLSDKYINQMDIELAKFYDI